jgi:hypothetical protein
MPRFAGAPGAVLSAARRCSSHTAAANPDRVTDNIGVHASKYGQCPAKNGALHMSRALDGDMFGKHQSVNLSVNEGAAGDELADDGGGFIDHGETALLPHLLDGMETAPIEFRDFSFALRNGETGIVPCHAGSTDRDKAQLSRLAKIVLIRCHAAA